MMSVMITIETRYLLPSILLCTLVVTAYARSWDLAVVIGSEIDFFARNGTLMGQSNIAEAVALAGVTYDDATRTMYLSDKLNNVSPIFSNDLTQKNFSFTPLLKKEDKMHIMGMVFDLSTRTLFWSDSEKDIIAKMHVPLDGKPSNPVIVHNLTSNSPNSIALDVCNRRIYWTNNNRVNPSIEYSNLDGSNRTIIFKGQSEIYEPRGVAIDHAERKLYWINDVEGIRFKIERSNLDGSEREVLFNNKHQQPAYLAVDSESIYWSDWVHKAIWTMPKNIKPGDSPTIFKSFDSWIDADPNGIVTRDNVGKIDCVTVASMMEKKRANLSRHFPQPLNETFNNLTTSTEESDLTTESSKYCLNGHLNETDNTCHCKPGFTGRFCEISICYNYCLRGKCIINHRGRPECECTDTFRGTRCEKDVCDDYCLFDGKCSVQNGKPFCSCKYSKGSRCEEPNNIAEICVIYCASNRNESSNIMCRCMDSNQTAERITLNDDFQSTTLLPIFAALTTILLIVIAGLCYYVNKLQRRPRIKRHYVVSKGVMPLTSRPEIPDNQCEITIENCCNMNICETPCFEPKLRTEVPRSNNTKKEEKNSLLDNMENNSC